SLRDRPYSLYCLNRKLGVDLYWWIRHPSDGSSAVAVAANPILHSKFKHVELDLFFVREKVADGSLLSFSRLTDREDGCMIEFSYASAHATHAMSPYAKFEVEISNTNGLYWITATAQTKEEDQSKETCTWFKFVPVNLAIVNYREFDSNGFDIFSIIDCKSLLDLPKYVAFKGYNNKYLCVRENYLAFSADDIGDSTVECETFVTDDGKVHIKSICAGKFWWVDSKWIWDKTMEEPVLTGDIYDAKYDLSNSRVYDETTFIIAKNTQEPTHMDMKLSYSNIKTSTWKSNFRSK
ncbi:hypothetical protein Goarm_012376, partial [Gossypium armourianum]|nr:hypothetical protein [Gossypium armourianum]